MKYIFYVCTSVCVLVLLAKCKGNEAIFVITGLLAGTQ